MKNIDQTDNPATGFEPAMRAALAQLPGGKLGFSMALEDAVHALGQALLIEIDPTHFALNLPFERRIEGTTKRICSFFLGSGPWHTIAFDFRNQGVYRELDDIHRRGGWSRDLAAHRDCVKRLQAGSPRVSNGVALDSLEKIDMYFESCARLLESVAANGVLRRPPFRPEHAELYETSAIRPLHSELFESDVGIGLGADGELYRVCSGLHRTAAAVLLGVRTMPVQLRLIHVKFFRRMLREGGGGVLGATHRCLDFARRTYGASQPVSAPPPDGSALPAIFKMPG